MIKRPFDDRYLFSYSAEHIVYEVDMFFGITALLLPINKIVAGSNSDAKRLNFAMIEACGIHLRNLIDFLYQDKPKPTDVVATDFCQKWQALRPPITSTLESARVRSNKELAHLTTSRFTGTSPEKQWNFLSLAAEIKPLLNLFVKNARNSALSPVVGQIIR